jgi:hypothetical protein
LERGRGEAMNINRNNYEAFFLDFHEGNLGEELKREVLAFVDSNPDLQEEFRSFEIISLAEKTTAFPGKEKLKKSRITAFNYKTWFVAYEENDLDEEGKREVEQFIELNPATAPELEILKRARILPDYAVHFANKSSLKKGGIVIPLWVRVAAAACLVIGLLSYWMIKQKAQREFVNTDQHETPAPSKVNKSVAEEIKTVAEGEKEMKGKEISPPGMRKPLKKVIENKAEEHLASNDSFPIIPKENNSFNQPLANEIESRDSNGVQAPQPQTVIVINESKIQTSEQSRKMVVLDENDLAELGLKEKTAVENKSLIADAVNGVGKLFGVNAHYDKEHSRLQSKYTETLALGPLAITRTVAR